MLLMLLILPLLIFCVLVLATDVRLYRNQLMVFGLVSSLLSGVVAVWIVRTNPKWEASTEIAWTGLEADTAGAPLKIGGSKQDKTMGWPDGAFAPQLTITALGSGQYRLQIARQAAFLVAAGRALNGEPIPDGKQVTSGGYRMSWRRYYVLQRRATLYDEKGPLGEFTIPSSGRDHVLPLTALIDTIIIDLRKTQAGAERARMLELWASRHWLFSRQREGIFTLLKHVLGLGSQAPLPDKYIPRLTDDTRQDIAEINANEVVGVMWQARSQQFNITNTDGRIGAEWQAPWVRNSPPPPKSETHPIGMVVGARALPGDYAFTLPLSDRMSNIRRRMFFSEGHFVESDKANPNRGTLSRYAPDFRRKATAALGNRLLSEITLDAEPYLVRLNSLSDMPDTVGVALIFLVAWGAFATACYLYLSLREHENPVILMGTTCTFWTFLLFRLVLALRYALDPGVIDTLATRGVENAVIALTILPSLVILILAGLRPSEGKSPLERRQQAHVVVLHVLGLSCIFYLVLFLTRYLWPNLSAELYFPGFSLWVSPTGAILICSIFMGSILFVVGRLDEGSLEIRALRRISDRLLAPLTIFNRIELYGGERVWRNTVLDREPGVRRSQDEHERRRGFVAAWLVLFISLLVMLVGIRLLQYGLPASFKMLQEVATPLVFYWIPAELLLAATLVRTSSMIGSRNDIGWMRALIVVGTIFVAVFLLPIAVKDAGGLLAAAAVFISATVVLVASKRPLKVGLICLGFLVLIGASVGTLVLNLDALHSTPGTPGEARVRILAFRDGEALKAGLAWFSLRRDDATGVVSEQKIANAIEHTWENQAIAHEGRWWGLGFGEAPTRRSQVRQNTIQADSAFSFYVLSEYGFAGGLFLMVAYLVPLLLIVSEPRNSFGLKLAASIAMSFFLEAAFHALMNLGALPFTGRDLPLLAVNSGSDLWRWTILLVVLAHAATWQPEPVFFAQREAGKWPSWAPLAIVLAVPVAFLGWLTVQSQSLVRSQTVASIFDWSPMLGEVNQLALRGELKYDRNSHSIIFNKPKEFAGTTLLEQEVVRFNALTETEKIEGLLAHHPADYMARLSAVQRVEDWQALMNELREADTQTGPSVRPSLFRLVRVRAAREEDEEASDESGDGDPDEGEQEWQGSDPVLPELDEPLQVRANPEFNTQVSFDAAPEPGDMPLVRWAGAHSGVWTVKGDSFELSASLDGQARVKTVTLVPENGSLLLSGSTKGESRRLEICTQPTVSSKQKPCLGVFEVASSKVVFTPAVPGRKLGSVWFWKDKFALGQPVDLKNGEQVRLRLPNDNRDHDFSISESSESSLVGPAWVRGQWISTYDPDHNIPWTGYLSRALTRGHRHSTEPGTQEFDALTLDARLQAAAQRFTANRGQALYTRRVGGKRRPTLRLPPRVALSVIRIPDGRAVALGGWPRMSSETFWYQEAGDWVPPLSWVEEHAPASIRAHYGGDRNFDKMLMGSTTKPLWASVVLNLHPGLASKLMVRGPKIAENAIFGIPIKGKAWEAPYSYGLNGEWCDLSSYLAHSDNRYQVRLGTLALAERGAGGLPESETPIFSPSTQESMDGGRSAWRRYPRFPLEVKFNYKNPGALGGLPDSSMAERWRKQFGVGIKSGELSYRTSFWTRSEADDHLIGQSSSIRRPTSLLNVISPEAADLALDHIESPRQYINLLLGGGSNMWANVDFAAAFATAVTGQPTLSHITQGDVKFLEDRVTSVMEASMIQPGTNAVLTNSQGTAYTAFRGRPLSVLRQFGEVYGKTGTLRQHKDTEPVSRIVVAVVRWSPDHKSVKDGLVFSMVVERGGTGVAASWLADFVTENEPILKRIMSRN